MKTPRTATIAFAILALTAAFGITPRGGSTALAATTDTFTVNSTADSSCIAKFPRLTTLRCAIVRTNAKPLGDTKLINFNISTCGGGVCKITLTQALPAITASNATIDGYTQPGSLPNSNDVHQPGGDNAVIKVQLDAGKGSGVNGLVIGGSNDTVRGLSITNFRQSAFGAVGGAGILITALSNGIFAPLVNHDKVIGNFIGLLPDGKNRGPNNYGVEIAGGLVSGVQYASDERVGSPANPDHNLISGNRTAGIYLLDSTAVIVKGNYIGTDSTGGAPDGNGTGISMNGEGLSPPASASPTGDTIGGAGPAGNIISGNLNWGIYGPAPASTKSKIIPNFTLIRFNRNAVIQGNYIGTNLTGRNAVANGSSGIFLSRALNFTIGDPASTTLGVPCTGNCNLIDSNGGDGIDMVGPGGNNFIAGNSIGRSFVGGILPNKGNGVNLNGAGASNPSLTDTVSGNTIANNLLQGIQVGAADIDNTHDVISQNSMFANKGGISIFDQGPDQCIFGPFGSLGLSNDYMGCPLIKSATPLTGITGEACAKCLVEVFIAPSATDNEGKTLLGTTLAGSCPFATQPSCWGTWRLDPTDFKVTLHQGQFITATATSQSGTLTSPSGPPFVMQTSQFSRDVPVGQQLIVTTTADNTTPCKDPTAYSLRCAIDQANKDKAGDRIDFNIQTTDANCASNLCKLSVATALPTITAPSTSINGYSQPATQADTNTLTAGSNAKIGIQLVGSGAPTTGDGLKLTAPWDVVEGLSIQKFADPNSGAGIHISGPNGMWDVIAGNLIGLDPSGAATGANQHGILLDGGATHGLIGFRALVDPNALSGNQNYGLMIEEGSGGTTLRACGGITVCNNVVYGNFIGTDPTGTAARGNGLSGVFLYGTHLNVIGAPGGQLGNVIGGNLSDGLDGIVSNFNWISGNNIGNSLAGTATIPNGVSGIFLYGGKGNLIGGPLGFLNLVGGNVGDGIDALAEPGIIVANNIVGAFHNVLQSEPNGGDGVFLGNTNNLAETALRKHRIPVRIVPRTGSPIVGYTNMPGAVSNNVISGNGADGILLGQTSNDKDLHIVMSQNPMGGNTSGGIAFTGSPLNACSFPGSNGPNDGVPCPTITSASSQDQQAVVSGTACPGCLVEVFVSSNEHGGYGEGQTYLHSSPVNTPVVANGNGVWSVEFDTPGPIVDFGQYVTATATTPVGGALQLETSEFSASFLVANSCPNRDTC